MFGATWSDGLGVQVADPLRSLISYPFAISTNILCEALSSAPRSRTRLSLGMDGRLIRESRRNLNEAFGLQDCDGIQVGGVWLEPEPLRLEGIAPPPENGR